MTSHGSIIIAKPMFAFVQVGCKTSSCKINSRIVVPGPQTLLDTRKDYLTESKLFLCGDVEPNLGPSTGKDVRKSNRRAEYSPGRSSELQNGAKYD